MSHEPVNEPTEERTAGLLPLWMSETPYWAISAVAHLILLLAIGSVILLEKAETRVIHPTAIARVTKPKPYRPPLKRHHR